MGIGLLWCSHHPAELHVDVREGRQFENVGEFWSAQPFNTWWDRTIHILEGALSLTRSGAHVRLGEVIDQHNAVRDARQNRGDWKTKGIWHQK